VSARSRAREQASPTGTGLALLDILSNGVGAVVILLTVFGTFMVAQSEAIREPQRFAIVIEVDSVDPLAAVLRAPQRSLSIPLTETATEEQRTAKPAFILRNAEMAVWSQSDGRRRRASVNLLAEDVENASDRLPGFIDVEGHATSNLAQP